MTDVLENVLKAVAAVKPDKVDGLSAMTEIASLELDSLDEVEVMMSLEEGLGIEIDQAQVGKCRTLGELAGVVGAARSIS